MKVCHLTSAHPSNDGRIFKKECCSLAKEGYEVTLIARGDSRTENGVKVVGLGYPKVGRVKRMLVVTNKVYRRALDFDADIYHIHDPELLLYAIKLKRKGKKVIFDSHEDVVDSIREKEYIPSVLRNLIANIYEAFQNSVLSKIDAIISVTPHLVEKLSKVNKNTVMITNYPILKTHVFQKKDISYDMCFGGGISKQWSLHCILKAMENIKDSSLVLCGRASNDYLETLKKFPSWKDVDYRGQVCHDELDLIYSQSRVGVALLDYVLNAGGKLGTLGNTKLFEYMQAGLPVICTDFVLWKEIIDNYRCGICVSPHNIDEIIEAIMFIKNNPEKSKQMGENGRKAVEERFNWDSQEKVLVELYQNLQNIDNNRYK